MTINYNQFGQLHDSTIVSDPYTGDPIRIEDVWNNEIEAMREEGEVDYSYAREIVESAEKVYIDSMTDTIQALDVDTEIQNALINNMITKGTAYIAYLETQDQEIIDRIMVANHRHNETDYDSLRASGVDRDDARKMI